VAGEVRKLAELSTESSKTIAEIVEAMQNNVELVTAVIETSHNAESRDPSSLSSVRNISFQFFIPLCKTIQKG
jgi:methyl-accepting chemotaxis protein